MSMLPLFDSRKANMESDFLDAVRDGVTTLEQMVEHLRKVESQRHPRVRWAGDLVWVKRWAVHTFVNLVRSDKITRDFPDGPYRLVEHRLS